MFTGGVYRCLSNEIDMVIKPALITSKFYYLLETVFVADKVISQKYNIKGSMR